SSLILDRTSLGVTKSAENNKVNLIVMGSHGVSGPKEYFVGSNTEKVVRNSNIPVLVIKDAVDSFNIDNFIFASDFSDGMVEPFKKALSFSRSMECKLHLLMVNTPNNFKPTHVAEEIVNNFLDSITEQDFDLSTYNDMTIEKGIINFSKKHGADLIGIATHGRTGLAHFFNGSISEDLVNHSATSVITFKID
ncbi:universal stress protein, partial [Myroides pelagicus]